MEASLRLYSLPRRELQALCKQYGIPTNKSNVAMADALSACVPVSFVPYFWKSCASFAVLSALELLRKRYQLQEMHTDVDLCFALSRDIQIATSSLCM